MIKERFCCLPILLLAFFLTACAQQTPFGTPTSTVQSTTEESAPTTTTLTEQPTQAAPTIYSTGGPFLLLQTSVDGYSLIDFADLSITPFDPPGPDREINLAENLSPSRTQMLFQLRKEEIGVYSFITGQIHTTYHIESDGNIFQTELAVQAAKEALPGLKYSDEALLMGVKNAFLQSIGTIQWFQRDRYRLTVLPAGEASTQLTLDDHQTGMRMALENQPGLVEAFWPGSDGKRILLKKGFMFEQGVWQDDRYYLVDVGKKQAVPILLPENADNPRVFWFSPSKIGIIHQPEPLGGRDFSLMDVASMETVQVVSGPFTDIHPLGAHLLSLHHDQQTQTSSLRSRSMISQDVFMTETIKGQCFVNARVDDRRLLLNCEEESILVEEDALALTPFGKPIFLFARSPNRSTIVRVTKDGQTSILNAALESVEEISIEEDPLEIRWLPDSSGFLYRTPRSLFLFDLQSKKSTFIIKSDLFGDYRNLNAVWVQLSE